jgi:hypothetical protein
MDVHGHVNGAQRGPKEKKHGGKQKRVADDGQ